MRFMVIVKAEPDLDSAIDDHVGDDLLGLVFGPAAGLELVDALTSEPSLKGYHLLPSARGDLLAKLGRSDEARAEFERAASLTRNAQRARARAAPRPRPSVLRGGLKLMRASRHEMLREVLEADLRVFSPTVDFQVRTHACNLTADIARSGDGRMGTRDPTPPKNGRRPETTP